MKTLLTDPGALLSALLSSHDLVYAAALAVPLAGLFLLAPGLAAVSIPQLAVNGLSERLSMTDPRAHYVAAVFPALMAATVVGLGRLSRPARQRALMTTLSLSLITSLLLGPWPWAFGSREPGGARPLWGAAPAAPMHCTMRSTSFPMMRPSAQPTRSAHISRQGDASTPFRCTLVPSGSSSTSQIRGFQAFQTGNIRRSGSSDSSTVFEERRRLATRVRARRRRRLPQRRRQVSASASAQNRDLNLVSREP